VFIALTKTQNYLQLGMLIYPELSWLSSVRRSDIFYLFEIILVLIWNHFGSFWSTSYYRIIQTLRVGHEE
jgi:hypothetical protein